MKRAFWLSSFFSFFAVALLVPLPLTAAETGKIRSIQPEAIVVEPPTRGRFTVNVSADRNTYEIGDRVRISFSASHDARVYIFNTDAEGVRRQIFPNYYDRDNQVRAGRTYTIPDSNYALRVTGPSGEESIQIVAYRAYWRALRDWSDFRQGDPFPRRSISPQQMKERVEREARQSIQEGARSLSIVPEPEDRYHNYAEDRDYFTVRRSYYRPIPYPDERDYPRPQWPYDRPYRRPQPYDPSPSEATARLRVTTDPDRAEVYIDGYYRGMTPETFRVEPGRREITLYHPDYGTRTTQMYLYSGRTSSLSMSLRSERRR